MTKSRRFLLLVTLIALVGYYGYNYIYKDHRDIMAEVSEIEIYWKDLKKMTVRNFLTEL
mgnify:CR=1 FL=1